MAKSSKASLGGASHDNMHEDSAGYRGRNVVDCFDIRGRLLKRKPALSTAERYQSKHCPVEMEVDVQDYDIEADCQGNHWLQNT